MQKDRKVLLAGGVAVAAIAVVALSSLGGPQTGATMDSTPASQPTAQVAQVGDHWLFMQPSWEWATQYFPPAPTGWVLNFGRNLAPLRIAYPAVPPDMAQTPTSIVEDAIGTVDSIHTVSQDGTLLLASGQPTKGPLQHALLAWMSTDGESYGWHLLAKAQAKPIKGPMVADCATGAGFFTLAHADKRSMASAWDVAEMVRYCATTSPMVVDALGTDIVRAVPERNEWMDGPGFQYGNTSYRLSNSTGKSVVIEAAMEARYVLAPGGTPRTVRVDIKSFGINQ